MEKYFQTIKDNIKYIDWFREDEIKSDDEICCTYDQVEMDGEFQLYLIKAEIYAECCFEVERHEIDDVGERIYALRVYKGKKEYNFEKAMVKLEIVKSNLGTTLWYLDKISRELKELQSERIKYQKKLLRELHKNISLEVLEELHQKYVSK